MASSEEYWIESLKGIEATQFPEIPANYQPIASAAYRHETTNLRWPGIAGHHWTASNDPATIIRVAWSLLIAQYANSMDIVMGQMTEAGLFPLRFQLSWQASIAEATRAMRQNTCRTKEHESCHLGRIRSLSLDAERACGFQFILAIRDHHESEVDLAVNASYALSAICDINDQSFSMQLRYDPSILEENKIHAVVSQMDHLVRQLTKEDAATTLSNINLLSSHDRQQIWSYNAQVPLRINKTITHVLEAMAAKRPGALALDAWDGQLTYRELMKVSNRLSLWLLSKGVVASGRATPVCIEKSMWTTVIILAIAQQGGIFVVLDPSHPVSHLCRIVNDLQASHIICTPTTAVVARDIGVPVCTLDGTQIRTLSSQPSINHGNTKAVKVTGDSPLYVVYTSGSTGAPKGALISHTNLCSAAGHQARKLGFNQEARSLDYSSYSFDAYVFNTFYTLTTGGCLCVPSDADRLGDVQGIINQMKVNLVQLTPSLVRLIDPCAVPNVQTLILTGEEIKPADLLPWRGRACVINAYGPSECTIMCAANIDLPIRSGNDAIGIGYGLGCVLWLQDVANPSRLAPVGAVGEIVVEGPIVGLGYLRKEELTQRTQVKNPPWLLDGRDGDGRSGRTGVVYRTGDLARYARDGTLFYLGRADSQTKLNGQRIETSAVESQLREILPQGSECVVDVVSTYSHAQLLVGFLRGPKALTADPSQVHRLVADIKKILSSKLLPFMIPSVFWPLADIPMTASGKIDRRRLRSMAPNAAADVWIDGSREYEVGLNIDGTNAEEHTNPMENALRELWVQVLGNRRAIIKRQDSFFQRGGDSIAAIKLVAIAAREGYMLDTRTVLRQPRLSDMAKHLVHRESNGTTHTSNGHSSVSLFRHPSPELLKRLARICNITVEDIEDVYPCSPIQEAMLAVTAQRPSSFVMRKVISLPPSVDLVKMSKAWEAVVAANAILRTRAVDTDTDGLLQVVTRYRTGGGMELRIGVEPGTLPRIQELHSFHGGAPLVYLNFTTPLLDDDIKSGTTAKMILTMHHALYDAWSVDLYLGQLLQAYDGKNIVPSVPYRDFIVHVAEMDFSAAQQFWKKQLETMEAPQFPALPGKNFQPVAQSFIEHSANGIHWPSHHGITPSTIARAACAILLASYTNSSDVVFGATVLGRQAPIPGIDRLAGPTIATVPVRVVLNWTATVGDALGSLQTQALETIPFEQYGIGKIRRVNAGAEQACQFQTLLVVQPHEDRGEEGTLNDAFRYRMEDEDVGAFSTHALTIICFLEPEGLRICLSFDNRVLPKFEARRIPRQMEHIVRQLCTLDHNTTNLRQIETASPEDIQKIWGWNATVPETVDICVHDDIAATAARQPDSRAVDGWDAQFTYSELLQVATRLASHLQALGVGPEVMVPTCFEKSAWAAVSMLAVIIAGGVGVALDCSQPKERLRAIISQTEARLVLAGVQTVDLARLLAPDAVIVDASSFHGPSATIPDTTVLSQDQKPAPHNALFIVFTSGSTGTPKGAVITHSGFSSATKHQQQAFGMTESTRVLDFASYAFDVAWFDLLHTLTIGACICIPSDQARRDNLVATIRHFNANYLFLTPSLGRYVDSQCAPTLKDLIMGGEGVGRGDMTGWDDDVRIRVAYGPAECTVMSNVAVFPAGDIPDVIHTGPGLGVSCWVESCFNPDLLAPLGGIGELVLEGPLLGRGYLGDPDKTASAFQHDPSWLTCGGPGHQGRVGQIYRTGDLVKFTDKGELIIIGRKDAMVKIRGQRVELEEVETHARRLLPDTFSSSTVAAEVVVPQGQSSKMLGLFIASSNPVDEELTARFLQGLAEVLPMYMVPSAVVPLPSIPATATGKVNRRGLRDLASAIPVEHFFGGADGANRSTKTPKRPPVTAIEKQLHALWTKILGLDPSFIGLDDNFLHIGGDSVSAMRLAGKAHQQGILLSVVTIFRTPRLVDMAQTVSTTLKSQSSKRDIRQETAEDGHTDVSTSNVTSEIARKLNCGEGRILEILPVMEFQQHSVECAELRPRAEWGYFSVEMGRVEPKRLYSTCAELYNAIEIFKTVFVPGDARPAMHAVVLKDIQPDITTEEVNGSFDECMYSFYKYDLSRSLSLRQPLTAFAIFHHSSTDETRLVVRMSHAHYDGLSLSMIAEALAAIYEQRQLPQLVPFSQFIRESSARTTADYQYWRNILQGSSMSVLSPDSPSCDGHSLPGRTKVSMVIPIVKARECITAATIIYASWAHVLSALTGSTDVVFGHLVSVRNSVDASYNNVIGPCINYVPVRATVQENEPRRLLSELQDQYIQSLQHQALGLSKIVYHCTDWPVNTVYGSTVHYQNIEEEPFFMLGGDRVRFEAVHDSGEADAPGCPRVTAYPTGSYCTLELSMPPEFGVPTAQKILADLAEAVEMLNSV